MRGRLRDVAHVRLSRDPPLQGLVVSPVRDPSAPSFDAGQFRYWKPDAQERALNRLREYEQSGWKPFYCPDLACSGRPHILAVEERECPAPNGHKWTQFTDGWACEYCSVGGTPQDGWTHEHVRSDQRPPPWRPDWYTLLFRGGRGSGKTRAGSELTNRVTKIVPRIILIGGTTADVRETMIEGMSGILATAKPDEKPEWEPSKKKLTWPNGCIGLGFTAEEPDRLRGPESGYIWADEPAHWDYVEQCWANMQFGHRLGKDPKIVATTTPKPTKWVKAEIKKELTVNRVVSTYANLHNLSQTYYRNTIQPHEGTRIGRQELHAEVLEDVEGALWQWDFIHYATEARNLISVVVAIDPAGSTNPRADDTGIIVLGLGADGIIYVLADYTGKYSPAGWGKKAHDAAEEFAADAFVAEKNYGGDMVKHVLDSEAEKRTGVTPRVKLVESRRGKQIRAEPVVALYEKDLVRHVGKRGDLNDLEEEQTSWVPGEGPSPNRVDALVHGATHLYKKIGPSQVANPATLNRGLPIPGQRPQLRLVNGTSFR